MNDRTDVESLEARGRALAVLGKTQDAVQAYNAALERSPNRESALRESARVLQTTRDYAESASRWERAIRINPFQQEYHGNLALARRSQGNWLAARDHAAECLKLAPDTHAIRKLYVLALLETGDIAKARFEFAKLEALNVPDFDSFRLQIVDRLR
jgi:tetratricopeptide (TPR) repeat protein